MDGLQKELEEVRDAVIPAANVGVCTAGFSLKLCPSNVLARRPTKTVRAVNEGPSAEKQRGLPGLLACVLVVRSWCLVLVDLVECETGGNADSVFGE